MLATLGAYIFVCIFTLAATTQQLRVLLSTQNAVLQHLFATVLLALISVTSVAQTPARKPVTDMFLSVLTGEPNEQLNALARIEKQWQPEFAPMTFETMALMRNRVGQGKLLELLRSHSGEQYGFDLRAWMQWIWRQDLPLHPEYPEFKSALYGLIDPRFKGYFGHDRVANIRLAEVVWGGVVQDGIPPLRRPEMIPASAAEYLADSDVVFGLELNGDARAYPKRILAWHEMFVDTVGGDAVAGVYCTLCGAMIGYYTNHAGVTHALGTSGFLYRSNKLMYDKATQSLWSTMRGVPVIGPLVDQGIELKRFAVVTSTWGEWRQRHPQTQVLSIESGHKRDYAEGAAYRNYFATDELMFPVPQPDARLQNKAEVFGVLLHDAGAVAMSAEFLARHPVYHDRIGTTSVVVLTDKSGANRAYASADIVFSSIDSDASVIAKDGSRWLQAEDALSNEDGRKLARIPAHRAFWFGWHAAFPNTRLVQ